MSAVLNALPVAGETAHRDGETMRPLRVSLIVQEGAWGDVARLERAIHRAATALARHPDCRLPPAAEASVVLGSDALLARLNLAYRNRPGATNVLSFAYQRPAGAGVGVDDEGYLGDVLLAAETLHREAGERGIALEAHVQHLVVHGLLHLLGRDHGNDAEAQAMEALETAILSAVGVADPHRAPPA
jgi:probable rRNA maturation factor